MNARYYLSFIIITLLLASCGTGKQLTVPVWFDHPAQVDTGKLRFDGYYTTVLSPDDPTFSYTALNPVFFIAGNQLKVSHGAYPDSNLFKCDYYKKYFTVDDLGKYYIHGDTIFAFVPVTMSLAGGSYYRSYNLFFSGIIVNREYISNWKAVPPFPKKIRRKNNLNNPQNSGIMNAHAKRFVHTDAAGCLIH